MIDLRSDTVTRPTREMREAMARAEVGDDVYGEDPTVNALEARAAAMFGREAAIFFPTGTMANQAAIRSLTQPGQELLGDELSHVFNYEMGAAAAISGVLAKTVRAPGGILAPALLDTAYSPPGVPYKSETGLLVVENTANLAGGTLYTPAQWDAVVRWASERNLPLHLDGARIFNAAVAQGAQVRELSRGASTVMFSLSKGLCAPVGSLLVTDAAIAVRARRARKMLGGGMRQAGIIAAAGIVALQTMVERLAEDHENARRLAEGLAGIRGITLDTTNVVTNILIFGTPGVSTPRFLQALRARGVLAGSVAPETVRMVTHRDVSSSDIPKAVAAVDAAMEESRLTA
ncbi:MAG: GntG family PLP-dependent aldolase [Acidobacteriota bacterium]